MNWTKILAVLTTLTISACTNQASLIPQDGPEMRDIYRSALSNGASDEAINESEAELICNNVNVDGSTERCVKKIQEILDQSRLVLEVNPNDEVLEYIPYTRTQQNELESLFPRLPNPDLVIYLYPHLSTKSRAPIPGYSTVIPLYERVQYRLPGESLVKQKK